MNESGVTTLGAPALKVKKTTKALVALTTVQQN